jgi:hypothetical protein
MQTSGTCGAPALQYQVAVEKKAQASVREQGKQAVELIQSAAAPPGTGTRLNVTA